MTITDGDVLDVTDHPTGASPASTPNVGRDDAGKPPRSGGRRPDGEDKPRVIGRRPFDDVASSLGSGLAAFVLVWLIFDQLLGLEGILGFLVCWFATYLATYATVTAIGGHPRTVIVDRLMSAIIHAGAVVVVFALITTLAYVFIQGWPALKHWNFYTDDMAGVRPTSPLTEGGILHAAVGTLIQIAIAVVIALPLGIGTAIYMTEVGGRLANTVRTTVEAMTALPDVLAGLFIYTLLIIGFQWERDGMAASLALATTMVPVIARSAEVALKIVPGGLREAGLALGSSHWKTVRHVVVPTAKVGIASSLILGIARVTGETAPLLIVSGASTFLNTDPLHEPMNSLPLFVFTAVRSGVPLYIARGYGAAALLMVLVLSLFIITRIAARPRKAKR